MVAGRPAMRLMTRHRGRDAYPAGAQRVLDERLPVKPAAVMLYSSTDELNTLALDFDVSKGGAELVDRDARDALQLLSEAGFLPWRDAAPTGGQHVYARLRPARPLEDVCGLVAALSARWPTLDISPLLNPGHGCIRPTGSPHKAGGYQRLLSPLDYVRRAAAHTPDDDAWERLATVTGADRVPAAPPELDGDPRAVPGVQKRPLAARWEQLVHATKHVYASDSEARMAVIGGCVRAGWSGADVLAAFTGPWRNSPMARHLDTKHRTRAAIDDRLTAEFLKAKRSHLEWVGRRHSPGCDTRPGNTRGAPLPPSDPQQDQPPANPDSDATDNGGFEDGGQSGMFEIDPALALRKFLTYATDYARHHSFTPDQRWNLVAVVFAGILQNRVMITTGCRFLALASASSFQTSARHLHVFAEHGLVTQVRQAQGPHAAMWRINVELGADRRPAKGRIRGLHPVFRAFGGACAGEVYQALTEASGASTPEAIASLLHYSTKTVRKQLHRLAGWDLARLDRGSGWIVGGADPDQLADTLGGTEARNAHHARHVEQRRAWHAALLARGEPVGVAGQINWDAELALVAGDADAWIRDLAGGSPPSTVERAVALVEDVLGGRIA